MTGKKGGASPGSERIAEALEKSSVDLAHANERTDQISDVLQRVARGDLEAMCSVTEKNDIFDGLAMGVNMMIDDVRSMTDELRAINVNLDEQVRQRTLELQDANRELEAFAYSVSHDLRSPLHHISGFAKLLERQLTDSMNEKSKHYMETIIDSANGMGQLIDRLLDYSRLGRTELRKENVDLNSMVASVVEELEQEAPGKKVEWKICNLPCVAGDRVMLRQVFVNLLGNAVKYSSKKDQSVVGLSWRKVGPELEFSVADNGAGFDMKYAGKLFGVFQRLHSQKEFSGTGIGLANVQRILRRHGGHIWAEAKIYQGATFFFTLPATTCSDEEQGRRVHGRIHG